LAPLFLMQLIVFSLHSSGPHRHLRSFPTRRSSDLDHRARRAGGAYGSVRLGQDDVDESVRVSGSADIRPLLVGRPGSLGTLRRRDRKSTRLNSSHVAISYAVLCLKKKFMTSAAVDW